MRFPPPRARGLPGQNPGSRRRMWSEASIERRSRPGHPRARPSTRRPTLNPWWSCAPLGYSGGVRRRHAGRPLCRKTSRPVIRGKVVERVPDRRGHAIALAAVTTLSAMESCGSQTSAGREREAWATDGRSRDDSFDWGARRRRAIALATKDSPGAADAGLSQSCEPDPRLTGLVGHSLTPLRSSAAATGGRWPAYWTARRSVLAPSLNRLRSPTQCESHRVVQTRQMARRSVERGRRSPKYRVVGRRKRSRWLRLRT